MLHQNLEPLFDDKFCEELSHPLLFLTGKFGFQFNRKVELSPIKYLNGCYVTHKNYLQIQVKSLIRVLPMHPFSTPWKHQKNLTVFWCYQGVQKGCIRNKWVNLQVCLVVISIKGVYFIKGTTASWKIFVWYFGYRETAQPFLWRFN